ncbi:MAG: type II secretion system protein [Streptococcus sp.]|nr:type II secretion system protein [Streptococcus sp.]
MKKHTKKRGMTLVEVIVALVILSTVAIGMLTFFSSSYSNVLFLRKQNKINFDIQKKFESELSTIKREGGHGTDVEDFSYTIGNSAPQSIKVKGQVLSYDDKVKKIRLFAANQKESVLELPKDLTVEIPNSKKYYYVGEKTPNGFAGIKGDSSSSVRIDTESAWFLSYGGIDTKTGDIVTIGSPGFKTESAANKTVFPKMLQDFKQQSEGKNGVTITDSMRGKYLTFAARAINSYGRVGNYQEADHRIWVMGLPVTKDLDLHTDADLATLIGDDKTTSAIPTDNSTYTNVDIRDYKHDAKYSGDIPIQSVYEEKINQARQFINISANNANNKLKFSRKNFEKGITTSILIGNRPQTGDLLTYQFDNKMTWGLVLTNDGKIQIRTTDDTNLNNGGIKTINNVTLDYKLDHNLQVQTYKKGAELLIEVYLDGNKVETQTLKTSGTVGNTAIQHSANSGIIYFGGNTYINEFAVYSRALGESELKQITDYFQKKYVVK